MFDFPVQERRQYNPNQEKHTGTDKDIRFKRIRKLRDKKPCQVSRIHIRQAFTVCEIAGESAPHKQLHQSRCTITNDWEQRQGTPAAAEQLLHCDPDKHHTDHCEIIQVEPGSQNAYPAPHKTSFGQGLHFLLCIKKYPQGDQDQPVASQRRMSKHTDC